MLPDSLLDWWFSPWTYTVGRSSSLSLAEDELGKRDGYRLWCAEARVDADLPARFDPIWSMAVTTDGTELVATARLYAGLLAAREHDHAVLNTLPFVDHKWCVRIASVQPLACVARTPYDAADVIEVRGLNELACLLDQGFPGVWPRLRLVLPIALADKIDRLRSTASPVTAGIALTRRAQRCWRLCRDRAREAHQASVPPLAEGEVDLQKKEHDIALATD